MRRINLLPVMDREAVSLLVPELREAVQADAGIALLADGVEQIGQAGIQLLLSAHRSAIAAGIDLTIAAPSDALKNACALAGVAASLPFAMADGEAA
ncbi:STAS domain-containing protein [Sphingomonas laterariae]|uniref:STAS domain-containing protein n=1 Tax=Edaphosphingomonas laterariae TaxID=861865 RepID=A0A239DB22_9SPHN|nr:STAS domain-containing protein [Sphingomonas laterariae]SNS29529.1 STAS domain-containing protein [Sphingomonas laterariae]